MNKGKKILLVLAAASLLAACGGGFEESTTSSAGDSTSDNSSEGSSQAASASRGMAINYSGDENLLGVSVFDTTYSGGYVYTPHVGNELYIVPSYAGNYTLDYVTLSTDPDTHIAAQVGTSSDVITTYMGELSLEGVNFAKITVPEVDGNSYTIAFTVNLVSKAAEGELVTVTLAETDNSTGYEYITKSDDTYSYATASTGINSSFSLTDATKDSVQVLKGSPASWFVYGDNMESFHSGIYTYAAADNAGTHVVTHNTLESSINDWMKTTGTVIADEDITINVTIGNGYKTGEGYGLSHRSAAVTGAFVTTITAMDYSTHTTSTTVLGANYHEVEFFDGEISDVTGLTADTDYVTVTETDASTSETTTTYYYKTVNVGDVAFTYNTDDSAYETADGTTLAVWCQTEANAKTYYDAVMNNNINVVLSSGNGATIYTKATLNKEDNGYGGTRYDWAGNRNAVCYFLQNYGMDALLATVQNETSGEWEWTNPDGDVVTAGTANDINSDPTDGHLSYAQILELAYNASLAE